MAYSPFYNVIFFDVTGIHRYKDSGAPEKTCISHTETQFRGALNHNRKGAVMSMTMRDYSEKRDFHRMQVNSEIQITDGEGRSFTGVCRDLSGTGMQLYVEGFIPEGVTLHTLLPSTSEQFPPFETQIRILRSEPHESGYLLGASIEKVKH